MGDVYVAEDLSLGRQVALKMLPAGYASSPERRERFEREARAVATLSHPNIVAIHEFGEDDGVQFAVTELLEGETLRALLSRGPLAISQVATWGGAIATGLAAAHARGVIHRDLKPENVFITADGQVKILDFGLASIERPSETANAATVAGLTAEHAILGTVGYMAPEQVRGEAATPRTDVFALGVVLYEMLTGRRAFSGDTDVQTLNAILTAKPLVPESGSHASLAVSRVISRCLEKDPAQRFQSARDVAFALDALVAVPSQRPNHLLLGSIAVAGAVAALLLGVWLFVSREDGASPIAQASTPRIVVLPFENLGRADDEYFAVGLSEEITARLSNVSGIGVISRNSAHLYASSRKSTRQIAEELSVDYILQGTVMWARDGSTAGGRVRVVPQLIRAGDDRQLWSGHYDRRADELFDVQSEIATTVSAALNLALSSAAGAAQRPTRNLDAYEAYLRGVALDSAPDRSWGYAQTDLIVRMFERAIALDPEFALAHARLSYAHSNMYRFGGDRTEQRLAAAKAAVDRALALQRNLAWGRLALGNYFYTRTEYERALRELESARAELAGEASFFLTTGAIKRRQGKKEEALADFRRAADLDPRSAELLREVGTTLMELRRFDDALAVMERSIALAPDQEVAYAQMAMIHVHTNGDIEAARSTLARAPRSSSLHHAWLIIDLLRQYSVPSLGKRPGDISNGAIYAF
jgi:serine/threonine protein kinase/tetratricopeptide (TPR) repeat protein